MDAVRVLVAEDHSDLRRLLDLTFENSGMEVVTACDGQDALDKLDEARPDVLVTDLIMPRLDGLELVRRVRERPAYAELPVLLLTAAPRDPRARAIEGMPRTRSMVKPPRLRDLGSALLELIGPQGAVGD